MKDPEFIKLITDASMGDGDAIVRLKQLIEWGEFIERQFMASFPHARRTDSSQSVRGPSGSASPARRLYVVDREARASKQARQIYRD